MPLIKYYSTDTCYDGHLAFLPTNSKNRFERHYPDEYLIADILQKYIHERALDKDIKVLFEDWGGNGNSGKAQGLSRKHRSPEIKDEGSVNSPGINKRILNVIDEAKEVKKNDVGKQNVLLLAPFLYGYHHPGIAIDVANKHALLIDPKTWSLNTTESYKTFKELVDELKSRGFEISFIKKQQIDADKTSCGPILTASMIQVGEYFATHCNIKDTDKLFEYPRPNLASERIFKYILITPFNWKKVKSSSNHLAKSCWLMKNYGTLFVMSKELIIVTKY